MTRVSVIIPAYNEERYIEICLKSLKKQSYKNYEIIVVDDGSTDKTEGIVKKFKNVRFIKGEHKGPGLSRNLGAKEARGEILVFIDADMYFDKSYIKNLIMPLKNKEIVGTTHDYEIATNTENKWSWLWGKIRVSKENARDVKIFRAIRKNKFLELGGFDQKYGYADDQTFWYKYNMKPVVAENTICYHKNPESLNETYKQARWIGASWKYRFKILSAPILGHVSIILIFILLPFAVLWKSFKKSDIDISFMDKARFYWKKFSGYFIGLCRAVFLNKFWK